LIATALQIDLEEVLDEVEQDGECHHDSKTGQDNESDSFDSGEHIIKS
jgi:hypothetical protein